VNGLWLRAAGRGKTVCALGASGRPLNFTVRRRRISTQHSDLCTANTFAHYCNL